LEKKKTKVLKMALKEERQVRSKTEEELKLANEKITCLNTQISDKVSAKAYRLRYSYLDLFPRHRNSITSVHFLPGKMTTSLPSKPSFCF